MQVANHILPLITLPYLVRVLGVEKFGLIAFAQSLIQYFVFFTDYGFGLSATREISINREDADKISDIFSRVLSIKLLFTILSFVVLCILICYVSKFRSEGLVYFFSFGTVLGDVLFPIWFFAGMEKMKYITLLNIIAKLIFTALIFVFVRDMQDYIYVPLISSLGYVVAGILGLWIVHKKFKVGFVLPDLEGLKHQLKDGGYIFFSRISLVLYDTSNIFVLGMFTNPKIVGYYSIAMKLMYAEQLLLSTVSQTIYPYVNKLFKESKESVLNFVRKVICLVGGGTFIISIITFILAAPLINVIFGSQHQQSILLLKILAFQPFLGFLGMIIGQQILIPFQIKKLFTLSIIIPSIVHIVILLVLVPKFEAVGVASVTVFTTVFMVTYRIGGVYFFHKDIRDMLLKRK